MYLSIGMLGFFVLPVLPVGLSFATEVSYPISEVMSVGTAMLLGQVMAVILTSSASIVGGGTKYLPWVPVEFLCISIIPVISSFFCIEDLKKLKASSTASLTSSLHTSKLLEKTPGE